MPNLRKIDSATFNAADDTDVCAKRTAKPVVKVYRGDVPTVLELQDIPANTYEWLVFVPCDLISLKSKDHDDDLQWPAIFRAQALVGSDNRRHARTNVMKCFDTYEMDERGMLFAFPAKEG
jgi:hypothetical protein